MIPNPNDKARSQRRRCSTSWAFTLIELLVVISIVGLLAAMVVGGASMVGAKNRLSRLKAEMAEYTTAIESYKDALGSYPPDNPVNPALSPLFYELSGMVVDNANARFRTRNSSEVVTAADIKTFFGIDGFQNATPDPEKVRTFVNLKSGRYKEIGAPNSGTPDIEVLASPAPWRKVQIPVHPLLPQVAQPAPTVNPWRYLSPQNATNNPGSFDLWVDYVEGREVRRLGNWSPDPIVVGTVTP